MLRTLTCALALTLTMVACGPLPTNRTGEVPSIKLFREWLGQAGEPVWGGRGTRGGYDVLDRDGRVIGTIRPLR